MEWAESIMPSIMMEGLVNKHMKEVQVEVDEKVEVVVVLGLCCGGCGVRSVVLGLNCWLVRMFEELVCVAWVVAADWLGLDCADPAEQRPG